MKRKHIKIGSLYFLLCSQLVLGCGGGRDASHEPAYDILVYGGTSGGFTAAIRAAEFGKKVALLEPTGHVGGINVEGLGGSDIDNHPEFQNSPAVGGMALQFYRKIAAAYGRLIEFDQMISTGEKNPQMWRFEPHVAEKVITDWLEEAGVDIFYNTRLSEEDTAVKKERERITEITAEDGRGFTAKIFIDATIEGDLLARAGVSTVIGREANAVYQEERNGIREHTTHNQFAVPVDPYNIPGDPSSGLIPTIQDEPLGVPGAGDDRLQAYCFRVCLTNDKDNQLPFVKPPDYDRGRYEIYIRYLKAGGKLYTPRANIPGGKTDLNGGADLSHNLYGMNYGYPGGNYEQREKIFNQHKHFTQGLFYFLANDPEVRELAPGLQQEWSTWGLAKDEFKDNSGWPRQFYVRDARRMLSDYVITEAHIKKAGALPVEDPVAVAFWPPDVHSVRRIVRNNKAYNEGFVFGGDWWKPFGVSYRSLVPKRSECTNLLTPTCPSSSHIAYGAIRIEWTFMALGQAIGTAASLALDGGLSVQDVKYSLLKDQLIKDKQVISVADPQTR